MIKTKTPGVYIQEISTLPASVAPVATAIPGFVGYTKIQGERDGETLEPRTPVRITSLLEFTTIFGGPYSETFDVTISDPSAGETAAGIDVAESASGLSPYLLYYQLQMYFANGGGPCHVISVGTYNETLTGSDIKESDLSKGIDASEEVDEITLLVVPEAIHLGSTGRENLNNAMLAQCNKLQDRFALMDVKTSNDTVITDGKNFRDNDVSTSYLKYGAAYYPSLHSTLGYAYEDADINIADGRGGAGSGFFDGDTLANLIDGSKGTATGSIIISNNSNIVGDKFTIDGKEFQMETDLSTPVQSGEVEVGETAIETAANLEAAINNDPIPVTATRKADSNQINLKADTPGEDGNSIGLNYDDSGSGNAATLSGSTLAGGLSLKAKGEITIIDYEKIEGDKFIINGIEFTMVASTPAETDEIEIGTDNSDTAGKIISALDPDKTGVKADRTGNTKTIDIEALFTGEYGNAIALEYIDSGSGVAATADSTLTEGEDNVDRALYNLIKQELGKQKLTLYPSAAMAGVYARTDRDRGVWRAPANTSLNLVDEPTKLVTDEEQGPLNEDPDTGKSINVIRQFYQKGTIVWGARTLAGNDNEWRYVPVRRLFIFIEESIQKATEPVVFEPNDANTWSKTKSMIENFLTGLWRDGALAGATAEEAFFVKVGLGQTMNATDILEGRMIIDVGIAAVRPAEFIILQFSHKLQEA